MRWIALKNIIGCAAHLFSCCLGANVCASHINKRGIGRPLISQWKHNWANHLDACIVCTWWCVQWACASRLCFWVCAFLCHRLSNFFLPLNYHKHTCIYTRYTGNFHQCKQPCVVDVWDWLREKQSCLKSHLGWEAAHMESYQIVLILLIGCSTLNRSSC